LKIQTWKKPLKIDIVGMVSRVDNEFISNVKEISTFD